jgi:hypothetical protein
MFDLLRSQPASQPRNPYKQFALGFEAPSRSM